MMLPLALAGCGPERDYSGVWQQTACEDGLARVDCENRRVYELHIGRYGDRLAGVVVRYVFDRSGFDNFQRPQECGCFLIEGGTATDDGMQFKLYDPGTPRYPQPDSVDGDLGCPAPSLLTDCEGRVFELQGNDEEMQGTTVCAATDDDAPEPEPEAVPIAFEWVVGQPRTECYPRFGTPQ